MYDKLLEIGTGFDWITPTIAFIQDWLHGSGVDFILPDDTGWSGCQVEYLLKSKGIRLWGLMAIGNELLFTVSRRQAAYAQYWLERAQLPYQGGVVEQGKWEPGPNAGWAKKKSPAPVTEPARGWWDKMFEW